MTLANVLKMRRDTLRKACAKALGVDSEDFAPDEDMQHAWAMLGLCRRLELGLRVSELLSCIMPTKAYQMMWVCSEMQPIDLARACLVTLTEGKA